MENLEHKILVWLATGETGVSSEAIAYTLCGIHPTRCGGCTWPSDPSDFKRCLKLLRAIPEIRQQLDKLRPLHRCWGALVDHWDELEACFMSEVGEWLTEEYSNKRASKTYDMMEKIYSDVA